MKILAGFIKRNQLISFFVLTFLISGGLWLSFGDLYFKDNNEIAMIFMGLGTFGPAIAGITITKIINPENKQGRNKAPVIAFVVGLMVSGLVFVSMAFQMVKVDLDLKTTIGLGILTLGVSLPPAFVISSIFSKNRSVRDYLRSLIKPSGPKVYYLIALLYPLLMGWLGKLLSDVVVTTVYYRPPPLAQVGGLSVLLITFFYQFFFANTLGEEVGWRGFALPRLQAKVSPLIASLVIAVFWFPWHLPFRWANPDVIPILYYSLSFIPTCIFLTWIYNRTNGSILAVGFGHVTGNLSGKLLFPISHSWLIVQMIFAVVLVLMDRMWEKLPPERTSVVYNNAEDNLQIP